MATRRWVVAASSVAMLGGMVLPTALASAQDDDAVVVAIIDAPDRDHPDLAGHVLDGENIETGGPGWDPPDNHGTAVAGQVLNEAPEAMVLPVSLGADPDAADLARAIEVATAAGPDILDLSVATASDDPALREAVAGAVQAGILVVAGAGNSGSDDPACREVARDLPVGPELYPAAYPGVVAVGGLDLDGLWWTCSNRGPHVQVLAPAVDLPLLGTTDSDPYRTASGTSYAAPTISGAAAFLLAEYPDLSLADVRAIVTGAGDAWDPIEDPTPTVFDRAAVGRAVAALEDGSWRQEDGLDDFGGCILAPATGPTVVVDDGLGRLSVTVDAADFAPVHHVQAPGTPDAFPGPAWAGGRITARYLPHTPLGGPNDVEAGRADGLVGKVWDTVEVWLGTSTDPGDYDLEEDPVYGFRVTGPLVSWAGPLVPIVDVKDGSGGTYLVGEDAADWSARLTRLSPSTSECVDHDWTFVDTGLPRAFPDRDQSGRLLVDQHRTGDLRAMFFDACVVAPGDYALIVAPAADLSGLADIDPNLAPDVAWWQSGEFASVTVPDSIEVPGGCEDDPHAVAEAAGTSADAVDAATPDVTNGAGDSTPRGQQPASAPASRDGGGVPGVPLALGALAVAGVTGFALRARAGRPR